MVFRLKIKLILLTRKKNFFFLCEEDFMFIKENKVIGLKHFKLKNILFQKKKKNSESGHKLQFKRN